MYASELVHAYTDRHGRTWYVVAEYRDGRYEAPQTAASRRLTGCSGVYGPLSYVFGNGYHYRRRQDALRPGAWSA